MDQKYQLDYSLTDKDIRNILNKNNIQCNIIEYKQLYEYNNLNQILSNSKPLIILYRSSPQTAHWCCLFIQNNSLEFHDSYGLVIDKEINRIESINKSFYDQYYHGKQLSKLIYNSPYDLIIFNQYHLQSNKPNINTCGRHCCTRLLFKDLTLEQYIEKMEFKKNNNLDYKVLQITNNFI